MHRNTRQRQAILQVLREARNPLLPKDILLAARGGCPGLGIATVYRTLKAMLARGQVSRIRIPGGPPRNEQAATAHHHYFRFHDCREVYTIPGCLGDFAGLVPEGFSLETHEVVLYGRCAECALPRRRA